MNDDDLNQAKERVRRLCTGHSTIHAIGASSTENAIKVYTQDVAIMSDTAWWQQVEQAAKPFAAVIVEEKPSAIQNPGADPTRIANE